MYLTTSAIETIVFLGIGVLPDDLKFAKGFKSRMSIRISLAMSALTRIIKPLKKISDSIYIVCTKEEATPDNAAIADFLKAHSEDPQNNLNIIKLLRCPISGGNLVLDATGTKLISEAASVHYPVINGIPIMVRAMAVPN